MGEYRCMLCGKKFFIEEVADEDELFPREKKSTSVCERCQAKLCKEAKDGQKIPKPM